jgi:hypothetical protein
MGRHAHNKFDKRNVYGFGVVHDSFDEGAELEINC